MTRAARYVYVALAWAFLAGVILQVFFIGLGLFAEGDGTELHITFGWILHLVPLPILAAAALSRAGRRHWTWALDLAGVVFITPILVTLRADLPVAAAFHPVGALVSSWLSIVVAKNATAAVRQPDVR